MPAAQPATTYTLEQVTAALNAAVDDVAVAADLPDQGTRDALNLVVNAALTYLDNPAADLTVVAAENYAEPLEDILGWIGEQ